MPHERELLEALDEEVRPGVPYPAQLVEIRERAKADAKAGAGKKPGRLSQLRQIYSVTRKAEPRLPLWMLAAFVVTLLVAFLLGLLIGHPIYVTVLGVPLAVMVALVIMSRIAERSATARSRRAGELVIE